ncbi:MAG: FAD-dependent oxidoreductase [Solirubrobacterales bacterium]|nr:FAD-dependent oxidoreductase [Solirubrobacterales bacterium]
MPFPVGSPDHETDTLVIGAGQAGLVTSYWLAQRGVQHQVLERRPSLGGAWQDRWDSFYLNAPNFSFLLPGITYFATLSARGWAAKVLRTAGHCEPVFSERAADAIISRKILEFQMSFSLQTPAAMTHSGCLGPG